MIGDVRVLTPSELPAAWRALEHAFATVAHPGDEAVELSVVDASRCYGAFDEDGRTMATAGSFDLRMTVPGARLPVAGVTWVGVHPTARRQGLLTRVMTRQLTDLHDGGTAVAALWASEGAIYGRYGYGPAAWTHAVTLPRGAAFRVPVDPGGVCLVEPSADALAATYEAVAAVTPGFPDRDGAWWEFRLHDPEHRRGGASPLLCAVTDGGYALYAVVASWSDGLPEGVVQVRELVAADDAARARLWRYLLDLDLTAEVEARTTSCDDPLLLQLLAEPRRARPRVRDNLWVRLVDAPQALATRRYACAVDVVLELDDPLCPWNSGRWRLTGDRSGADCTPTSEAADLVVTPADLGAAYLGGTPLRARGVQERTPGALAVASTAFGSLGPAPWCPQVF